MPDTPDLLVLIDALRDPEAYPHPVRSVQVIQTHTSCVFLTGSYVYKIKKPVNFGFLDYSTAERRRHFCEQELALNQRLSPEVYLDTVPIGWQAGRLRVGAPGEVLEWAVRMRQLPEEDLMPARLAAGTVTPAHLEQIATRLAELHATGRTDPAITAYGTSEAVSFNVEENFRQTEGLTGPALPVEHLTAIQAYARRFLTDHADLLLVRMAEGRIRDGHGDLRAQNICLHAGLQGGIQILDCIEFNDRLRYGDVAADLAYLAMDLDLAGRADLRRVLVDRYCEVSSDPGLHGVLPFYQCYRAYVRGKIALLAAAEPEMPAIQRDADRQLAAAAFDLARSYAEGRTTPALLITVGFSGSGKSVLARELARRLPAVRIGTDEVRKERAEVLSTVPLTAEHYVPAAREQVYAELYHRAGELLARGEHVLLDGTFLSPRERENAAALARDLGAEFWIVECYCPDSIIRQRLQERSRQGCSASDADRAVYEMQSSTYEPRDGIEALGLSLCRRLRVGTDQPAHHSARQVLHAFWEGTPH